MRTNRTIIIIIILIILTYHILTVNDILDSLLFPTLGHLYKTFISCLPNLLTGILNSSMLLIPSFFISILAGITLGLILGWNKSLQEVLIPIIYGLSPIPAPLYTPYAIMIFPTFRQASMFIIFIGSFWSILGGTISGVNLIEKRYIDNARCLNISGVKLLRKIILPASMPHILSSIRNGLNSSFMLLIIAEMFGAESGLGYFIQYYSDFAQYDKVFVGIIFVAFFIVITMFLFDKLQNKLLFWKKSI